MVSGGWQLSTLLAVLAVSQDEVEIGPLGWLLVLRMRVRISRDAVASVFTVPVGLGFGWVQFKGEGTEFLDVAVVTAVPREVLSGLAALDWPVGGRA